MKERTGVKKFVVVPCKLDSEGHVVISAFSLPPYGYHHIYKVYKDDSFWLVATINSDIKEKELLAIAKIVACDKPIEINHEFTFRAAKKEKKTFRYSAKELQQEDWDKILSIPFSKRELAILDIFRQNNNQPVSYKKIRSDLLKQFGHKHCGIHENGLNARFSTMGLSYRLKGCGEKDNEFCLKLFVIESR